jgi:hypothetical protein
MIISMISSRKFYGLEYGEGECMEKRYEQISDQNERLLVYIVMANTMRGCT